jgi:hypothetical protein
MAEDWLEAPSKSARARVFASTGVRWSELLRLPYWDPTRAVVVDGMHNLFLGLVQFHVRNVLQIAGVVSFDEEEEQLPSATPEEMLEARKALEKGPTKPSDLKKVKIPALLSLCAEFGIVISRPDGGRPRRADVVRALIVGVTQFICRKVLT